MNVEKTIVKAQNVYFTKQKTHISQSKNAYKEHRIKKSKKFQKISKKVLTKPKVRDIIYKSPQEIGYLEA